jgi:hypothetical protein
MGLGEIGHVIDRRILPPQWPPLTVPRFTGTGQPWMTVRNVRDRSSTTRTTANVKESYVIHILLVFIFTIKPSSLPTSSYTGITQTIIPIPPPRFLSTHPLYLSLSLHRPPVHPTPPKYSSYLLFRRSEMQCKEMS